VCAFLFADGPPMPNAHVRRHNRHHLCRNSTIDRSKIRPATRFITPKPVETFLIGTGLMRFNRGGAPTAFDFFHALGFLARAANAHSQETSLL